MNKPLLAAAGVTFFAGAVCTSIASEMAGEQVWLVVVGDVLLALAGILWLATMIRGFPR